MGGDGGDDGDKKSNHRDERDKMGARPVLLLNPRSGPTPTRRWRQALAGERRGGSLVLTAALSWFVGPAAVHASYLPPAPLRLDAASAEPLDVTHLRRARVAVARGELDVALAHFDAALRVDPRCVVAHLGRAVCLAQLGRSEDASRAMEEAHRGGDGPDLVYHLSRTAAREGNAKLAMDLLGQAVAARPALADRVLADPAWRRMRDHPRLLSLLGHL